MKLPTAFSTSMLCLVLSTVSCATAKGANSSTSKPTSTITSAPPPKVQPTVQYLFAKEVAGAGPKAEGWALFSDSSMGNNGQRWIIKSDESPSSPIRLCIILQQDKACKNTNLTIDQFAKIEPILKTADGLSDILPTVFDGLTFEYLHVRSGSTATNRVVFISSAKPFPDEYEALVRAFNK